MGKKSKKFSCIKRLNEGQIATGGHLFERYPSVVYSDVTFVIFLRWKFVPRQLVGYQTFMKRGALSYYSFIFDMWDCFFLNFYLQ